MSMMGQSESIRSMSSRLVSGRGSKNTGWKPSSVSISVAELASTASSSPRPCALDHLCYYAVLFT